MRYEVSGIKLPLRETSAVSYVTMLLLCSLTAIGVDPGQPHSIDL